MRAYPYLEPDRDAHVITSSYCNIRVLSIAIWQEKINCIRVRKEEGNPAFDRKDDIITTETTS